MDLKLEKIQELYDLQERYNITFTRYFTIKDNLNDIEYELQLQKAKIREQYYQKFKDLQNDFKPIVDNIENFSVAHVMTEYNKSILQKKTQKIYNKLLMESREYNLQLSRNFTMDDSLTDLENEYENLLQRRIISLGLQGLLLINEKYNILNNS